MVAMESYLNGKNSANRIVNGHSNIINNYGISELETLQNSQLGHVFDTGFSVDWTDEEQRILDEGLIKFANEPPVMKYVKIAGLLMDKTTHDVAMRCNWMKKKRRKQNQPNADKKMTTRKEVPSKENLFSAPPLNMALYSHVTHDMVDKKQLAHEAYHGPFQNLLQENAQLFSRIDGNFSALQENLDLFRHTRSNILTLLNNMTDLRGTLSTMPLLPVSINDDLANTVLQDLNQVVMDAALTYPLVISCESQPLGMLSDVIYLVPHIVYFLVLLRYSKQLYSSHRQGYLGFPVALSLSGLNQVPLGTD